MFQSVAGLTMTGSDGLAGEAVVWTMMLLPFPAAIKSPASRVARLQFLFTFESSVSVRVLIVNILVCEAVLGNHVRRRRRGHRGCAALFNHLGRQRRDAP